VLINLLWFLFISTCLLLMLIVLLQRGEAGGLGSAFGGGGGDTAFGVKADTTWKKATAFFAILFMALAVLLGRAILGEKGKSLTADEAAAVAGEEPGAGPAPVDAPAAPPENE
jgi:preprotein translocase subunit SecG